MHSDKPVPKPTPRPGPPPPGPGPPPPPRGPFPASVACITALAANGSAVQYCAGRGETATSYTVHGPANVSWVTVLTKTGAPTVTLTGYASALDTTIVGKQTAEFAWVLDSAVTAAAGQVVRAVDLEFGFVGLPSAGDQHYTTHQEKQWCPPSTGCQEWRGADVSCTVGEPCDAESLAAQYRAMPGHEQQDRVGVGLVRIAAFAPPLIHCATTFTLCTTAHPLYTEVAKIFGAPLSEATMRPDPRWAPRVGGTRRSRSLGRTLRCSSRAGVLSPAAPAAASATPLGALRLPCRTRPSMREQGWPRGPRGSTATFRYGNNTSRDL
jgi:hypothetical protein